MEDLEQFLGFSPTLFDQWLGNDLAFPPELMDKWLQLQTSKDFSAAAEIARSLGLVATALFCETSAATASH